MKNIFDDFTIFNDLSTHLEKFKKCFFKCREFGISLSLDKCAFKVFSRTVLGFLVSKKGKIMDPKKVEVYKICEYLVPHIKSKFSKGWHNFRGVLSKKLPLLCQ
jgi:hypothetical protein